MRVTAAEKHALARAVMRDIERTSKAQDEPHHLWLLRSLLERLTTD